MGCDTYSFWLFVAFNYFLLASFQLTPTGLEDNEYNHLPYFAAIESAVISCWIFGFETFLLAKKNNLSFKPPNNFGELVIFGRGRRSKHIQFRLAVLFQEFLGHQISRRFWCFRWQSFWELFYQDFSWETKNLLKKIKHCLKSPKDYIFFVLRVSTRSSLV